MVTINCGYESEDDECSSQLSPNDEPSSSMVQLSIAEKLSEDDQPSEDVKDVEGLGDLKGSEASVLERSRENPKQVDKALDSENSGANQSTKEKKKEELDGQEKQLRTFLIHKVVACRCPYFERAFQGSFIESQTQSITVNANPDILGFLVEWMYTQLLPSPHVPYPTPKQLCHLWILADMLLLPDLQNQAINSYYEKTLLQGDANYYDRMGLVGAAQTTIIWKKTATNSPLRRIIVQYYAMKSGRMSIDHPKEMIHAVALFGNRQVGALLHENISLFLHSFEH